MKPEQIDKHSDSGPFTLSGIRREVQLDTSRVRKAKLKNKEE
jgi:hypothetical protein